VILSSEKQENSCTGSAKEEQRNWASVYGTFSSILATCGLAA